MATHIKYINGEVHGFLNLRFWQVFTLIVFLKVLLLYAYSRMLWSDEFYLQSFKGNNFDRYMSSVRTIDLIRYIGTPFYLLLVTGAVALTINAGAYLFRIRLSLPQLLKLVLLGELILLLPDVVEIVWFTFFQTTYTLDDLGSFEALSILNLMDFSGWPEALVYPFTFLNLFQVCYVLFLAYGVSLIARQPYRRSLGVIASSYGTALLVYIMLATYLKTIL